VFVAPALGLEEDPSANRLGVEEPLDPGRDVSGTWESFNADFWRRDLRAFAEFFFAENFPEAHSTRHVESCVEWALDTDGDTLAATQATARRVLTPDEARACAQRVACPCLVVQGDQDRIVAPENGPALAESLGAPLVVFEGCGHGVPARHPVRFNLLVREFAESVAARPAGVRW
jgi:pimeloyl-ACP methyl ester carboxylesterase